MTGAEMLYAKALQSVTIAGDLKRKSQQNCIKKGYIHSLKVYNRINY